MLKNLKQMLFLHLILLAILASGCDSGPIYQQNTSHNSKGNISRKAIWTAAGAMLSPANAIDDNIATASLSSASVSRPALMVDLGKACLFNMVVIDHGSNQAQFPNRIALHTSMDGDKFIYQSSTYGTRRVSIVSLYSPVLARYIRLEGIGSGSRAWAIAEVYLQ